MTDTDRRADHHTAKTFGTDGVAPNTCMCYCRDCWDDGIRRVGLGRCICPDCQNPHHDHRARAPRQEVPSV